MSKTGYNRGRLRHEDKARRQMSKGHPQPGNGPTTTALSNALGRHHRYASSRHVARTRVTGGWRKHDGSKAPFFKDRERARGRRAKAARRRNRP